MSHRAAIIAGMALLLAAQVVHYLDDRATDCVDRAYVVHERPVVIACGPNQAVEVRETTVTCRCPAR